MAYITAERVKEIRDQIKKEFPGYKVSVTREHFSGVRIAIIAAPYNLLAGSEDDKRTNITINTYYIQEHFAYNAQAQKDLLRMHAIANAGNFDKSDLMTDYHHVGFYVWMEVGRWNKPFTVIETKAKKAA